MRIVRMLRGAIVVAAALGLAACAALPTTGDVRPGLAAGQADTSSDVAYVPQGPSDGMDPEQIVRGFIDAASSPKDSWGIAREYLTSSAAQKWKPDVGVTIDASLSDRRYDAPTVAKGATAATVRLGLQQTANVDENGNYSGSAVSGSSELPFSLAKGADGQWRITSAPDGIVLDAQSFAAGDVFAPYALEYFDPTWTYLVPDVRWFPKRENTASRIVQSLVTGKPSPWLTNGVRTAFTGDVALARNTVTPVAQVAEVALTDAALSADAATLARMRTQLERSLADLGVQQVKLTVGGRDLNAGSASAASTTVDSRPLVLTDKGFGFLSDGEVTPVAGVSAELTSFPHPITAIRASSGAQRVVVQTADGVVYAVADGKVDEFDSRPGLAAPALDPFGYIWTVPQQTPQAITAWSTSITPRPITGPQDASQLTALAMSRDGSRLAMAVVVSGQIRVEVAAVTRDDRGAPTAIGPPSVVSWPPGPVADITWLDDTTVGVLTSDNNSTELLEQPVGGPKTTVAAPDGTRTVAPAPSLLTIRLLGGTGVLWVRSGPNWPQVSTNVKVLGVQLGG
ncbi:LpqB family beta-propeller domain-containing protein [Microbacterium panaciterrae]|uniref:LpqB family beta-propeller domain-containing protein n=1 Tax=Microbacterium panaciterrae TaxID=985759 RepID=A0ABP8PBI3_9MICO